MIDIVFYNMIKYFTNFHNNINNYEMYKNIKYKDDFVLLNNENLKKFNISYEEYTIIQIYIKLLYCYFNNYEINKIQKQINQLHFNTRKSLKQDI
jgi:high-affinity Fe2+/Pb2+ permease